MMVKKKTHINTHTKKEEEEKKDIIMYVEWMPVAVWSLKCRIGRLKNISFEKCEQNWYTQLHGLWLYKRATQKKN